MIKSKDTNANANWTLYWLKISRLEKGYELSRHSCAISFESNVPICMYDVGLKAGIMVNLSGIEYSRNTNCCDFVTCLPTSACKLMC